jgi:DNA processing protein
LDPLAYWIAFNRVRGIGPARLRALLDAFGSIEEAWHAPADKLREVGLDRRSLANMIEARGSLDLAAELGRLRAAGVSALTWEDPGYPARLLTISDAPPVLYVRGQLRPEDDWAVAMVGTRQATVYGREAARHLAGDLASAGVTIVSGLAVGIDAEAHRAALDAKGRTIAVLGCGIDIIYPWENRKLAEEIAARGVIVSDYAFGTKPEANNFPPRNRIISGLSRAVVVVEAGERSGALITARFAAEQGRDVLAVPGSIFNRSSQGANMLIREGARPVLSANDVLEELDMGAVVEQAEARTLLPADETEALVLQYLSAEPMHVDDVRQASGLPIATVSSTLALMELKGLVRQVGGMNYVRARETGPVYRVD